MNKSDRIKLKDSAKLMFCKLNKSQKEIAELLDVSEKTIGKWKEEGKWESYRTSLLKTKEELLKEMYAQLEQFNQFILRKPEGMRFPDSKEADAQKKITLSIKDLETELGINTIADVCIELLDWLKPLDYKKAQEAADTFDNFIKSKLK